jgi:hypothetical protein
MFYRCGMRWKVALTGPAGKVNSDTNAFRMLFPFAARAEADEIARFQRFSWPHVAVVPVDDAGNILERADGESERGGE